MYRAIIRVARFSNRKFQVGQIFSYVRLLVQQRAIRSRGRFCLNRYERFEVRIDQPCQIKGTTDFQNP